MTISKHVFYLCITFLSLHYSFAQTKKHTSSLDSLHTTLNEARDKEENLKSILALCKYYKESYTKELDSLYYYANGALTLSDSDTDFQEQKVEALYYLARHAIEIAYQTAKDYKLPEPIVFNTGLELIKIYLNNRYNKEIVAMLLFENAAIADDPDTPIKDSALFYFYLGFYYDIYDIDIDKSIANYNKSIALYMQINDEIGLFYPLINSAEVYQKNNDHQKAIEVFNRATAFDLGRNKTL